MLWSINLFDKFPTILFVCNNWVETKNIKISENQKVTRGFNCFSSAADTSRMKLSQKVKRIQKLVFFVIKKDLLWLRRIFWWTRITPLPRKGWKNRETDCFSFYYWDRGRRWWIPSETTRTCHLKTYSGTCWCLVIEWTGGRRYWLL